MEQYYRINCLKKVCSYLKVKLNLTSKFKTLQKFSRFPIDKNGGSTREANLDWNKNATAKNNGLPKLTCHLWKRVNSACWFLREAVQRRDSARMTIAEQAASSHSPGWTWKYLRGKPQLTAKFSIGGAQTTGMTKYRMERSFRERKIFIRKEHFITLLSALNSFQCHFIH